MVSPRAPLNDLEWNIRDLLIQRLGDYVLLGVEQTWGDGSRDKSANRAFKEITETAGAVMKLLRFKQEVKDEGDKGDHPKPQDK